MRSAFADQEVPVQDTKDSMPNGKADHNVGAIASPSDSSSGSGKLAIDAEAAPAETHKKWGLGSFLHRGKSDSVPPPDTDSHNATSTAPAKASKGWFGGKRSRHSRQNSADPALPSDAPPQEASNNQPMVPIVGLEGLHLVESSTGNGTSTAAASLTNGSSSVQGDSPRRQTSISAPASTLVTPDLEPIMLPASASSTPGGEATKGPAHRRHRSLLETLGWGKPPRGPRSSISSSLDLDSISHADADGSLNALAEGQDGSGHAGHAVGTDIALLEIDNPPEVPAGTRGISNIGNSCFLNAALQCLKHTPGLPLVLIPDLIEKAEEAKKAAENATENENGEEQGKVENNAAAVEENGNAAVESTEDGGVGEGGNVEPPSPEPTSYKISDASLQESASGQLPSDIIGAAVEKMDSSGGEKEAVVEGQPSATVPAEPSNDDADTSNESNRDTADECPAATAPAAAPAPAPPPPRPEKGELAAAIAGLFSDLFIGGAKAGPSTAACIPASPSALLATLRRFPIAADYFDGRQQDCQEVLQIVLDLLHEDLNRVEKKSSAAAASENGLSNGVDGESSEESEEAQYAQQEMDSVEGGDEGDEPAQSLAAAVEDSQNGAPPAAEDATTVPHDETSKADTAWESLQNFAHSPISDLFMGQLQSSVTCMKCGGRFTMYEPFWELSLPLAPKTGGTFSWLTFKPGGSALQLQDCLRAFTADEKLEGKEAFHCEKCNEKTSATKHLRLHRLPDALVLHVKRFRHGGGGVDKLTTDVVFPLKDLDLHGHLSPESPHPPEACCYDLYAVSYHTGTLAGGHYLAACKVQGPDGEDTWWQFNDESVTAVPNNAPKTQHAYILFYSRRKFKDPAAAAAVFGARNAKLRANHGHGHKHSRSRSGGSSGGGGFLFKSKAAKEAEI